MAVKKKKPGDWGYNPVKKVALSKGSFSELVKRVEATGKKRKEAGALVNEADYFCGAMAAMEALGVGCPVWPLFLMSGRSVVDFEPKPNSKKDG